MPFPPLIDSHAHRRQVLDRAHSAGVEAIVAVGETLEDALRKRRRIVGPIVSHPE